MSTPTQCCDMGSDGYAYPVYDMFGIVDTQYEIEVGPSAPVVVKLVVMNCFGRAFWCKIERISRRDRTMAGVDINTLTMEQYLALSRENQASGMVKPEIRGNVNFEIKSQFMRELREDTFSGNKNKDAHDHVDRVLNIGPIPVITPTQALTKIQTMADHSQKWHDGTSSRNVSSSSNTDGLAAIDLTLTKNVLSTRKSNSWKRSSMENLGAPLLSTEVMEPSFVNQSASLKNLETQIEQLTKELKSRTTNGAPSSSTRQCKVVNANHEMPNIPISSSKLNNLPGVSFLSDYDSQVTQNSEERTTEVLQCKLPSKEQNPGNFTLLCPIGNFNFYVMADLGASVNVMPKVIFEFLKLTNLRKINMLIEVADMTKKAPLGVVENILVGIDKFLSPSDFVIINRTHNETIILGRPFLATIHAKIYVFDKEISLGVGNNRIMFDMKKKDPNFMIPMEKIPYDEFNQQ
ncbi:putative reverse transcriptase domain-containing protein [Tanacetum coccineum]